MDAANATLDGANRTDAQQFPIAIFAAVGEVSFATSDSEHPQLELQPTSGVVLSQLAFGEFALTITGSSYRVTMLSIRISPSWVIVVDNETRFVRWSPPPDDNVARWMHLRFASRRTFADFNRHFWPCIWETEERVHILHERLGLVGHTLPSNFTRYCRQYLGEDYFDTLQESDEDEPEGPEESEDGSDDGPNEFMTAIEGNE